MRSSLLSACLALATCLTVTACGGAAPADASVLRVAVWDTGTGTDPIDTAVAEFRATHPGVTVELDRTAYAQYEQSLRLQLSTGQPPDVVRLVTGYGDAGTALALADRGVLSDLTAAPWVAQIPPAATENTNKNGKTYALPVDSAVIGTFYDPAKFTERGIAVPTTFADVLAICRKVHGSGTVAFAMGADDASGMTQFLGFALAASTAFVDEPDFAAKRLAGQATFAGSPGWLRALQNLQEMVRAGCFSPDAAGTSQEAASQSLGQGSALMAVAPTLVQPLIQAGDPAAKFAMFPFPGAAADSTRVNTGPISGLGVPARARNPQLAREFLDFYAANRAKYAAIDDSVPAIPAQAGDPGVPGYASAVAPLVAAGRTAPIMDGQWPNPEVLVRFKAGITGILLGQQQPLDVLTAMDAAWTSELPK
ncbi:ABC transporter substrate-binding protein [Pseudonocardia sp. CA-107938]|uniref:ABC transporter substrate-binding protein n=1 Tax=Pseudonocardia sp. CA-107938 TaxID=3240021 RepID=UPI003D8A18EA